MPVLVFDVNETLLDLASLRPGFDEVFGPNSGALREWFLSLLHASGVANDLNRNEPFSALGVEALNRVALRRGVDLDEGGIRRLLAPFATLPAHPDVIPGLTMLADAGLRMAALTNSPYDGLEARLQHAGIASFFERILSVDEVGRFKPARDVYLMAARELGVDIGDVVMVAAHDWDIRGAIAAGARGAFIARPGAVWGYADVGPDFVGGDLMEVATQIIDSSS